VIIGKADIIFFYQAVKTTDSISHHCQTRTCFDIVFINNQKTIIYITPQKVKLPLWG